MAKFDLDTPIKDILADPQAKALLEKIAPALVSNPMVTGLPMSINQIKGYAADALNGDILDQIKDALASLSEKE